MMKETPGSLHDMVLSPPAVEPFVAVLALVLVLDYDLRLGHHLHLPLCIPAGKDRSQPDATVTRDTLPAAAAATTTTTDPSLLGHHEPPPHDHVPALNPLQPKARGQAEKRNN
jgi:hypothetical protein